MTYLDEFQTQINSRDYSKFLQLWEEYCTNDVVDVPEFVSFLKMVKASEFAKPFGKLIETAIPLWQIIPDENDSFEVMKHLIDLANNNSPMLLEIVMDLLKKRFGNDPKYQDRLRLIGLRGTDNFQGALTNYELLAHVQKGKFVFHTSGWGTGEIMDISEVREQLAIEYENVSGLKHITFSNAFKTLIPLPDDHFLARRFSDPDKLEKEAREDPVGIIKVLLRDLGPKTASEIKDELEGLVIPEADWTKWWSTARTKLKKDTMIESPVNAKTPFRLRKSEVSHEERLAKAFSGELNADEILMTTYNFVRDFPNMLKKPEVKASVMEKITALRDLPVLSKAQELQIRLFLETMLSHEDPNHTVKAFIESIDDVGEVIDQVEILAFKKQMLVAIREYRTDWIGLFLTLLEGVTQSNLRDYILKELLEPAARPLLEKRLNQLVQQPAENPELFVWYFQKLSAQLDESLPFGTKTGLCQLFESFLILYNAIEQKAEYRDLLKKMYNLMSGKRFAVVRQIIEGTDEEFLKEILLLTSKCQTLSDHDLKILRSLAAVVQPSLQHEQDKKKKTHLDSTINWTTEEGYRRIQERCQQIGTVEIVENAREVEEARALGDLRENSEYKFACEKRSRLQGELKTLSDQLKRARIIRPDDVDPNEVGIGSVVTLKDGQGKTVQYTILGAWDADPDRSILSLQSKLAQAMLGAKVGDAIPFKDDELTITAINSVFSK